MQSFITFQGVTYNNTLPHPFSVYDESGTIALFTLAAADKPLRLDEKHTEFSFPGLAVPAVTIEYGFSGGGVPEEKPGILYIVSKLVQDAYPHRRDFCCPGALVRDGVRILGCTSLAFSKAAFVAAQ